MEGEKRDKIYNPSKIKEENKHGLNGSKHETRMCLQARHETSDGELPRSAAARGGRTSTRGEIFVKIKGEQRRLAEQP